MTRDEKGGMGMTRDDLDDYESLAITRDDCDD